MSTQRIVRLKNWIDGILCRLNCHRLVIVDESFEREWSAAYGDCVAVHRIVEQRCKACGVTRHDIFGAGPGAF